MPPKKEKKKEEKELKASLCYMVRLCLNKQRNKNKGLYIWSLIYHQYILQNYIMSTPPTPQKKEQELIL
jgi:hypothetical protein